MLPCSVLRRTPEGQSASGRRAACPWPPSWAIPHHVDCAPSQALPGNAYCYAPRRETLRLCIRILQWARMRHCDAERRDRYFQAEPGNERISPIIPRRFHGQSSSGGMAGPHRAPKAELLGGLHSPPFQQHSCAPHSATRPTSSAVSSLSPTRATVCMILPFSNSVFVVFFILGPISS